LYLAVGIGYSVRGNIEIVGLRDTERPVLDPPLAGKARNAESRWAFAGSEARSLPPPRRFAPPLLRQEGRFAAPPGEEDVRSAPFGRRAFE